mmetsp:Transcript_52077/g.97767  ORF Transcript_52077/g.97767 Transcript_52077/m.97767 type:complete len:365 (+) Transcript_52077:44-1138(+)
MRKSCRRRLNFKDAAPPLNVFAAFFLAMKPLAAFNPGGPGVHHAPNACMRPGSVDASAKGAVDVQRQVESEARPATGIPMGRENNLATFHRAIAALAEDGAVKEAEEWFNMAVQTGFVDIYTYNLMIRACAVAGEYREAENWHRRILKAGFKPDVTSYNNVMAACATTGEFREAEKWFENIVEAGLQPDITSYKMIIDACAAAGECYYSEAELWFQRAVDANILLDVSIFNAVIRACSFRTGWKQAQLWFDKIKLAQLWPDEDSYRAMIEACARAGNYDQASKIMMSAERDAGIPMVALDVCNLVMEIAAERGDHMQAGDWMSEMLKENIMPDVQSYNAVIRACTKGHAYEEAKEWFKILENGG